MRLDRASATPLAQQIRRQLAAAARAAAPGERLPSTRLLARMLRVSRNTVLAAYEELAADGLIEPRRGVGTVIAGQERTGAPTLNPQRVLRDTQYPARVVRLADPDGASIYIVVDGIRGTDA
jgi:GntR family transcriptional regulator/MocR family aminotransferase